MTAPTIGRSATDPVERDLRTILAVQALRAFVYGFSSVVLGTALADGGLSDVRVGLVFTAMLVGTAITSIAVGLVGDRIGRRPLYTFLLATMGIAGTVYAFTGSFPVLALVALSGTLSTDPNESGPITSLEQAMMGSAPAATRTRVFGRYNAVAYLAGALGALSGGGPTLLRHITPTLPPDQRWLLAFPIVALMCAALSRRLSTNVEPAPGALAADAGAVGGRGASRKGAGRRAEPKAERGGGPVPWSDAPRPLTRSRRTVAKLAGLFALDAFAGGFVVGTFIVFWFHRRYGTSPEILGAVLFAVGLVQAGSSIASGFLAMRIGMLNTMVFTHLPSNVLLLLVPVMPTFELAVAMLVLRSMLSQMDVPARQAYVVAMVDPDERTAAAAFTNTARYVARPFGAAGAAVLMQNVAFGAPFVVAGTLKGVYDILLYLTFRKVPLPEEKATPRRPSG